MTHLLSSAFSWSVKRDSPHGKMKFSWRKEQGVWFPCKTGHSSCKFSFGVWILHPFGGRWSSSDFYGGEWITKVHKDFKGVIDIDQDFSLIIKDVRVESSATYYCTVGENGTRRAFTNSTIVNVFGKMYCTLFIDIGWIFFPYAFKFLS